MDQAIALAVQAIAASEGCRLTAYPDPATGGVPWTIGYGETEGVTEGMVWTHEQAVARLNLRVGQFLIGVVKRCPQLHLEPPERVAACVCLAYNIGLGSFWASSVRSMTQRREYVTAADRFLLWNKAAGRVMRGLTLRRQRERLMYLLQAKTMP